VEIPPWGGNERSKSAAMWSSWASTSSAVTLGYLQPLEHNQTRKHCFSKLVSKENNRANEAWTTVWFTFERNPKHLKSQRHCFAKDRV
jgi:hypothetical protein